MNPYAQANKMVDDAVIEAKSSVPKGITGTYAQSYEYGYFKSCMSIKLAELLKQIETLKTESLMEKQ